MWGSASCVGQACVVEFQVIQVSTFIFLYSSLIPCLSRLTLSSFCLPLWASMLDSVTQGWEVACHSDESLGLTVCKMQPLKPTWGWQRVRCLAVAPHVAAAGTSGPSECRSQCTWEGVSWLPLFPRALFPEARQEGPFHQPGSERLLIRRLSSRCRDAKPASPAHTQA